MKFQKLTAFILSVLLLLSLAGCGAAAMDSAVSNEMAPANGALADDYMVSEKADADGETKSSLPENRKLIQTVNMNVETENLDGVLAQVDTRVAELGGYIEVSNVQNGSAYGGKRYRYANITVRIPANDLDSFVNKVGEITNIVCSKKTVEDITLSYVATESRMKALQTEETRLLELLAKAETMDDLLAVESRLTDVRTELEQVTSALRVFDNQVNYATVRLDITEVTEYTEITEPENVWQRIGKGFVKSLKGVGNFFKELFVFVIVASPYLALIGLILLVVILVIRWIIRRTKKKYGKKQ